jgi:hypothetical protein
MTETKTTELARSGVSGEQSQTGKQLSRAVARARMAQKIRSELNIEKWPAIWQPAKSKNKAALRTMQREMLGEDGIRIVSRVEVGFTQLGTLTTEEQKLLYVLIKLWEDADKPDVQVFFSTREDSHGCSDEKAGERTSLSPSPDRCANYERFRSSGSIHTSTRR